MRPEPLCWVLAYPAFYFSVDIGGHRADCGVIGGFWQCQGRRDRDPKPAAVKPFGSHIENRHLLFDRQLDMAYRGAGRAAKKRYGHAFTQLLVNQKAHHLAFTN